LLGKHLPEPRATHKVFRTESPRFAGTFDDALDHLSARTIDQSRGRKKLNLLAGALRFAYIN
jgi:hypothetical protein